MKFASLFNQPFNLNLNQIRLITALLSLTLSIVAFALDNLINSDGVLYMNMARALIEDGFSAMADLYDWPFFAILTAGVHILTGFPLERCGEIINIAMFVVFTDALVLICAKMLPNHRQVFIAALFILGFTLFLDYRAYLFRDLGYWAFISLGLYQFIRFIEVPSWKNAFLWQVAMVIAILFRIEGVAITVLLPIFLLYHRTTLKQASKEILMLWSSFMFIGAIVALIAMSFGTVAEAFGKLSQIWGYLDFQNKADEFYKRAVIIDAQVMSRFAKEDGALILASGLLVMMTQKFITALSIGYIIFYLITRYSKQAPTYLAPPPYKAMFIYFIGINFIILAGFVFDKYFLSTRYSVMLITALFLLMLPRFCQFVENAVINKRKATLAFTAFVLIAGPIDSLTSSVYKGYVKETALWAAENIPEGTRTRTFDVISDYYFREYGFRQDIELDVGMRSTKFADIDYVILVNKRHDTGTIQKFENLGFKVIFSTGNRRGDQSLVLKSENE